MYPSSPSVSFTANFSPPLGEGTPRTNQLKASFNLLKNHHSWEWRDSNVSEGFIQAPKCFCPHFAHILTRHTLTYTMRLTTECLSYRM